jgi:hypothetical protein
MAYLITLDFSSANYQKTSGGILVSESKFMNAEETQRLASLYERKLAALDTLKKSLLHQAFTGEL